jgi:hypothetical protein
VSAYTTMGTVSSSALFGSLIDLDVLDDQIASVETLGIRVGFSIFEETKKKLCALDGPSSSADTESLACRNIPSALFIASQ